MTLRTEYRQSHYTLYEIILPYCTVCTPVNGLATAWHTPVTCEESSDDVYSLWLTANATPMGIMQPTPSINIKSRLNSSIFKCISSASETTPRLKPGEGLSSRGTMSITCSDFDGDPGPINFSDAGTFFGKLRARNVLDGKKIITHYFTIIESGGTQTIYETSTSTHFITTTQLSGGQFTLSGKDALKDVEGFGKKFPAPSDITLTADIDETTTSIPVTNAATLIAGSVFRIDEEIFRVQSVALNTVTCFPRGSSLSNGAGAFVYETQTDSHNDESTVQPCYVMSLTKVQDVFLDLFNFADLGAFTDYPQWDAEINEWNADSLLTGLYTEPEAIDDILNAELSDYMIDMWLDQSTQKIQVATVSAWKQATRIIEEGNDFSNLKISTEENTRYSRAQIYNQMRYQAGSDEVQNYSRLTEATDLATESSDFYGSPKVKDFGFSNTISRSSSQILCARYIQRFAKTPKKITLTMPERKAAGLSLSSVVDIVSRDTQAPDGSYLTSRDRAQIIKIQPVLNKIGREYNLECLTYAPLIASDPNEELVIFMSGTIFDDNLFARAGAPNVAINVTFVLQGCTVGSTAANIPAIRAGNFVAGTRIRIICTDNAKWSGLGGDASSYYAAYHYLPVTNSFQITSFYQIGVPTNGGICYQSDGIETDIYLNWIPIDGFTANSELYAPSGGGASNIAFVETNNVSVRLARALVGAGGGSGIPGGTGGNATIAQNSNFGASSMTGNNGIFSQSGTSAVRSDGTKTAQGGLSITASAIVSGSTSPGTNGISSVSDSDVTNVIQANVDANAGAISGGLAGGAIKGTTVTVYNELASSGKFIQGDSDPFTLITA